MRRGADSAYDDPAAEQHDAEHRHAARVAEILEHRSDLQGVIGLADLVVDGVRWSA